MGHLIRVALAVGIVTSAATMYTSTARAQPPVEYSCKKCSTLTDSCFSGYYEGGTECSPWSPCEEIGDCIVT
jgi:hypothetical protein